ncbi:hypothetical protein QQX98_002310 [Neonectria punicea]|uniref:Uncharacterized protein n=1 Tax=Neonectria punicea TaxID=979145 RepID=A0ABR1HJA6_9HYPO
MASKEMIMNLPRLLVPQRLEAITSVEILWDFEPFPESGRKSDYQPLADCKSFQAFLNLVPTVFPKLESLYISLQGCLHYKSSEYPSSEEELFAILEPTIMLPVDNMVRKLGAHVTELSIAIPNSIFYHYQRRAKSMGWKTEKRSPGDQRARHWRPLADCPFRSGYWVPRGKSTLLQWRHTPALTDGEESIF